MVSMQASPSGMDGFRRKLDDLQRQINVMRGAAFIRSSILRAASFLFQSEDGDLYATLGQFDGKWWEHVSNTWDFDTIRGLAIGRAGDSDPSFAFGHAVNDNKMTAAMGEGTYGELDGFIVKAAETRIRNAANTTRLVLGSGGEVQLIGAEDVNITAAQIVDIDSGGQTQIHSGTSMFLVADGGTNNIDASGDTNIGAGGNVDIDPSGDLRLFIGSHATPANLSIASNVVRIVSSAAKYKDDIEDIVVNRDELFSMSGKTYVDKGEKAESDNPTRYPGFIADEWAGHETLRQFVVFDDDGEVESFYYDRVSVALLEVAKQQQAEIKAHEHRISELEAENAALNTRLNAIESRLEGAK